MKHGKKYTEAAKLIESSKTYDPAEALELCCKTATAKFDETVELHVRLGAADFGSRDDGSVTIFGDFKGTAKMVEVTVADENIINLNVFGGESFRIIVQIRVEDTSGIIFFQHKAGRVEEMEFCGPNFPS